MKAVILAGGKGVRLMPFTTRLPKPLMPIGELTILEHLLHQLRGCGVTSVTLCTGHHAELIEKVVRDAARFQMEVRCRRDRAPSLSTLAPVRELRAELPEHFLMLNADILCDLDFGRLHQLGVEGGADLTVAAHQEVFRGKHPRCELVEGDRVVRYEPRPALRHWVNMGIYVLRRAVLERVPGDKPYGMDSLMRDLLAERRPVRVYRSTDTWLDVGLPDDLARAQELFVRTGRISAAAASSGAAAAVEPVTRSFSLPLKDASARWPSPPRSLEESGVVSMDSVSWGSIYTDSSRVAPGLSSSGIERAVSAPRGAGALGALLVSYPPGAAGSGKRLPIAMVCGSGPAALIGSERFALRLAGALAEQGAEVSMVLQTPGEVDPADLGSARLEELPGLDLRSVTARVPPPAVVVAVDLVWPGAAQLAQEMARTWRVPSVVVPASAQEVWLDRAAGLELCGRADAVLVVTPAEGRALARRGIAPGKLRVTGYGSYSSPPAGVAPNPDRFGLNGDYVLFLGRKLASKGYRELLDAAPLVWRRHPEVRFVFAGPRSDPDWQSWFARSADPRILELEGLTEREKNELLAGCALLCLPTTSDVFPQVFVEAWSLGKAVISGRFDGAEEVVRSGVDGLIAEARPEALAGAIGRLLEDPMERDAMGWAGRERVARELSWPAVARRVTGLLRELVSVS